MKLICAHIEIFVVSYILPFPFALLVTKRPNSVAYVKNSSLANFPDSRTKFDTAFYHFFRKRIPSLNFNITN